MNIALLIALTVMLSGIVIFVSFAAISEGVWNSYIGISVLVGICALWFWISLYLNSEPIGKQESKTTTIHETIKDDGSYVQWFYDFDNNYQPLACFYKNPNEYIVTVYVDEEQSRYGIYPKDVRKTSYKVNKKGSED